MIRTIFMIVGIVFATMAFMFMVRELQDRLRLEDDITMTEIQTSTANDSIRVSWSTDVETNGALYYNNSKIADYEYDRVHSLILTGIEGSVSYYIESCDPEGVCVKSDNMTGFLSIVRCPDGTKSKECSSNMPQYCDNGELVERCMICGCPAGSRCITSGSCTSTLTGQG